MEQIQKAGPHSLMGYQNQTEIPDDYKEVVDKKVYSAKYDMTISLYYSKEQKNYIIGYSGTTGATYAFTQWGDASVKGFAELQPEIDGLHSYVFIENKSNLSGYTGNSAGLFWVRLSLKRYGGQGWGSGGMNLGANESPLNRAITVTGFHPQTLKNRGVDVSNFIQTYDPAQKHPEFYQGHATMYVKQGRRDIVGDTLPALLGREVKTDKDITVYQGFYQTKTGQKIAGLDHVIENLPEGDFYGEHTDQFRNSLAGLRSYYVVPGGIATHTDRAEISAPHTLYPSREALDLATKSKGFFDGWGQDLLSNTTFSIPNRNGFGNKDKFILDTGVGLPIVLSTSNMPDEYHAYITAEGAKKRSSSDFGSFSVDTQSSDTVIFDAPKPQTKIQEIAPDTPTNLVSASNLVEPTIEITNFAHLQKYYNGGQNWVDGNGTIKGSRFPEGYVRGETFAPIYYSQKHQENPDMTPYRPVQFNGAKMYVNAIEYAKYGDILLIDRTYYRWDHESMWKSGGYLEDEGNPIVIDEDDFKNYYNSRYGSD